MQLDKTHIAIRERDLPDLLDLGLHVIRAHGLAIAIASIVGMTPFALLNYWWLKGFAFVEPKDYGWYTFRMVMLVLFETPLAAVPVTLFLGQTLFFERFELARAVRQAADSLPQLLIYQVILRGLLMPEAWVAWDAVHRDLVPVLLVCSLLSICPFAMWPYLNEAILLERNPLFTKAANLSTWKRSGVLHKGQRSELFGKLIACSGIAAALTVALWLASWHVRAFFSHHYDFDITMFTVHLPLALWVVAAFFNVVRFLSYLDLRIRREGWEVELLVRAEADRLRAQQQFVT